ncbi:IS110 family transposase [Roseibacillus ishigakijimensis]
MNTPHLHTIGIDLGDRNHHICVLDESGDVIRESSIRNEREALALLSSQYPTALIAMEVGAHSPWLSRYLEGRGHRVIVANARKLRLISQNERKCDQRDAVLLARLARADENLLHPIQHGSEEAQRDLLQIKLRDNLVRQRVNLISGVRMTLKSLGIKTSSPKTTAFAKKVRCELHEQGYEEELALITPVLFCGVRESLCFCLRLPPFRSGSAAASVPKLSDDLTPNNLS